MTPIKIVDNVGLKETRNLKGLFVYVLYKEGKIMYIGKTRNIDKRIKMHKVFFFNRGVIDSFKMVRCKFDYEMDVLEKYMIKKFKPELNILKYDWFDAQD